MPAIKRKCAHCDKVKKIAWPNPNCPLCAGCGDGITDQEEAFENGEEEKENVGK